MNLEKLVVLGLFDVNTKSQRVREKCGFRYHHTKRTFCALEGLRAPEHITHNVCVKEEWISIK